MKRLGAIVAAGCVAAGCAAAPAAGASDAARECRAGSTPSASAPGWLRQRRMTVLVDSVLLGGMPALRRRFGCWRVRQIGRPALMLRTAEREVRARRRVDRLVVVGLGYNSLWERGRRRHGRWARRFDREARRLLATLRRRGARQVVWVTLREPTARVAPPSATGQLRQYAWYFPYVNERLLRLDRRRDDLALARWDRAGHRRGVTYDAIHLNPRGSRLMARTIQRTVARAARQAVAGTGSRTGSERRTSSAMSS